MIMFKAIRFMKHGFESMSLVTGILRLARMVELLMLLAFDGLKSCLLLQQLDGEVFDMDYQPLAVMEATLRLSVEALVYRPFCLCRRLS